MKYIKNSSYKNILLIFLFFFAVPLQGNSMEELWLKKLLFFPKRKFC